MKKKLVYLSALCFLQFSWNCAAAFFEQRPLSFGTIAIRHNLSVSTLTIPAVGNSFSTNALHIVQQGQPAEWVFSGYPAFTTLNISPVLPIDSSNGVGSNPQFKLTNLDIPSQVTVNGIGVASVVVGATLETSGTGGQYIDTDYQFVIFLNVTY
jgi:hypothetical protein